MKRDLNEFVRVTGGELVGQGLRQREPGLEVSLHGDRLVAAAGLAGDRGIRLRV